MFTFPLPLYPFTFEMIIQFVGYELRKEEKIFKIYFIFKLKKLKTIRYNVVVGIVFCFRCGSFID